jgi:hypothetical protein
MITREHMQDQTGAPPIEQTPAMTILNGPQSVVVNNDHEIGG